MTNTRGWIAFLVGVAALVSCRDTAHAQNCGVATVEIQTTIEGGRRDTYYRDTLVARDSAGTILWSRRAPLVAFGEPRSMRMADAWLEASAVDSNVVLYLTDGRLQVFGCDGMPLRNMWFADRLPAWGWEINNGSRNADGRTVRIYGADHVGPALRAFALDVEIDAMIDTSVTTIPSDRMQAVWEWSTQNDEWVWDEHMVMQLDFADGMLVLQTGHYNPFYDGEWEPLWIQHARYEMDPNSGMWTNTPCLAGDLSQNGVVDRRDAEILLRELMSFSRGLSCRDPDYPFQECLADLNRDGVFDIEDVVELYLRTGGRSLSVLDAPRDSTRWEVVDPAAPDSTSEFDHVQLGLVATDQVLGFHLRFEGPVPSLIETPAAMRFFDDTANRCGFRWPPVEIVAAADTAITTPVLLTLDLPRQEDGSFAQELRVLPGSAIGADGVRYEWGEQVLSLVVEDDPPPPVTPQPPPPVTLHQNRPNPFNPDTWIDVEVLQAAHVQIDVFDARGHHVVRLLDRDLPTGTAVVEWKGQDAQGQLVSSGLYYYRIRSEYGEEVRKMALIK